MSPLVIADSPYGHPLEHEAAATNRTRAFSKSPISTSPLGSTATPASLLSSALVAAPPSPENPAVPSPATV